MGLGPLTTLAFASSSPSMPAERIFGVVRWSLVAMLVTGILIVAETHGVLGKTTWVRVSFALFIVLGALTGMVRRRLKRGQETRPFLWAMCALVAAITYVMEAKPWW
jgi:uncharacterized membrane protein SirB2